MGNLRWLVVAVAGTLCAQEPQDLFQKAPPDIDSALRARISRFYQLQTEGKHRQAEELVAEDSKDIYYAADKTKYLSFEIVRILYSDNFTKAKAQMLLEMYVMVPGFTDKPMKVPIPSTWKLDKGEWCWYVIQQAERDTPWGKVKVGNSSGPAPSLPSKSQLPTVESIQAQVKANRNVVQLKPGGSEQVEILNSMPGPVSLSTDYAAAPGFDVQLNRKQLAAGEKAVLALTLRADAKPPRAPVQIKVRVVPTNQVIPIEVKF